MELLGQLVFWHWWVLAGLLLVIELVAPNYFFLWLSIGAVAVGFLVLAFPAMAVGLQLLAFGLLTVVAAVGWRRHRQGTG